MSNNLLLIPEKDFAYCAVFKAGSSAWLEKVVKLSGKSPSPRFTHEQVLLKAKVCTILMRRLPCHACTFYRQVALEFIRFIFTLFLTHMICTLKTSCITNFLYRSESRVS